MIKHTQKNCRLISTNILRVFDHFWGLAVKRLMPEVKFVDYSIDLN